MDGRTLPKQVLRENRVYVILIKGFCTLTQWNGPYSRSSTLPIGPNSSFWINLCDPRNYTLFVSYYSYPSTQLSSVYHLTTLLPRYSALYVCRRFSTFSTPTQERTWNSSLCRDDRGIKI